MFRGLYNIQMSKKIDAHILNQFKIGHLMGSGAYGHVWRVQEKHSGKQFALKKIFGAFRNSVDAQRTYREVQILQQLKHPNIIKLIKVLRSSNKQDLYLVFQLMQADLMAIVGTNVLSVSHKKFIIFQVLKAVQYLHGLKLIHRDLKPSNVLVDSECNIKICDFGLVRSLNTEESQNPILSEEVATKWYRAPELLLGSRNYSYPVDIWSVGCILGELLIGKTLFTGKSTLEQVERILQFIGPISKEDVQSIDSPVAECLIAQLKLKVKSFSDYFSLAEPVFYPLIKGLLCFNPQKRISISQALNLQIFKQFKNQPCEIQDFKKPITLCLNDNLRFSSKQYRKEIYSSVFTKQQNFHKSNSAKIICRKKEVNAKLVTNSQSHLKINSKSLIAKTTSKSSKIKDRTVSKNNQTVSHILYKIDSPQNKFSKKRLSCSHSLDQKYNPYRQIIKQSNFCLNKYKSKHAINPLQKKSPNIKKVNKNFKAQQSNIYNK